jgi:hypothetical protein
VDGVAEKQVDNVSDDGQKNLLEKMTYKQGSEGVE